jgi:hypothetical protein
MMEFLIHNDGAIDNFDMGYGQGFTVLTLQGPTLPPVITSVNPILAEHGQVIIINGTGITPSYHVAFTSGGIGKTLQSTKTSITCIVPANAPLGATTVYLDNGVHTSNTLAFTVAANILVSPYSNELAINFPQTVVTPPPATLVSLSIVPQTVTVTEGQSISFSAIGSFSDGSSATLTNNVTWSEQNFNGVGSIDPTSGLFVAQSAGNNIIVRATVPIAMEPQINGPVPLLGFHAVTAVANVVVAQRPPDPVILKSLTITPADLGITTGTTTQYHATGLNSVGGVVYPPVTWSVQGGVLVDSSLALNPIDFAPPGSEGSYTRGAVTYNSSTGQIGFAGTLLESLQSSYLSTSEFFWMEWQATNTQASTKMWGPCITDGLGNSIVMGISGGTGTLEYKSSAGSISETSSLNANTGSTNTEHLLHLGLKRIDDSHTRVIGYVDGVLAVDFTMNIGWLSLAYPGLTGQSGSVITADSFRMFFSAASAINGIASINSFGLLTATRAGQITVNATAQDGTGVVGSTTATISDPVIVAPPSHLGTVTISPPVATCRAGETIQFTATVLDQFGNPYPDTDTYWSVTNILGSGVIDTKSGLFTGQLAGSNIVIKATVYSLDDTGQVVIVGATESYQHQSATAAAVVVPGPLQKITVTPPQVQLQIAQAQQFTAVGYDRYNNSSILTNVLWTIAGGVGTTNSSGFFTASTAGVGKIIASQNSISGAGTINVLAVSGGVAIATTPQQPFARITIRDVVEVPTIIDSRVRGGGLINPALAHTDDFWWDISTYDGKAFNMFGVYAARIAAAGNSLPVDVTINSMQDVFSKFGAPQFLPVIVANPTAPVTPF